MAKIGNVNILDVRNATEESIAGLGRVGNVNIVLYSPETAHLVSRINVGNLNATVQAPANAAVQQVMGKMTITRDNLDAQEPIFLVVMGQVIIGADVVARELDAALAGLIVMGQCICPKHVAGVIRAKAGQVLEQIVTYPPLARVEIGGLTLDAHYLRALDDGTELAVVGELRAPQVLPNDLVEQKLARLYVRRGIKCHEENARAIQDRLVDGSGPVKVIPAGFELVERPLLLDASLLSSLPASKLYCTERVQVEGNVSASALKKHLDGLASEDVILCPAPLKDVLATKCSLLENRVVFYEGDIWLIDGARTLTASRFDALEGKATLVVVGVATLDPDVAPQVLADRLARVHNLGLIRCTPEQMAAVEARLGLRDGELHDSTPSEESDEPDGTTDGETRIGNVNFLAV